MKTIAHKIQINWGNKSEKQAYVNYIYPMVVPKRKKGLSWEDTKDKVWHRNKNSPNLKEGLKLGDL